MHFTSTVLSAAALAATVVAQSSSVLFTSVPSSVTAGKTVHIGYKASGPVTILLRRGPSTDLHTISTLTTSSTGGSYEWTPESSLSSGSNYALEILQGGEVNYSQQFSVLGGSSGSSSSSTSSAPATTSSGASTTLATSTVSCSTAPYLSSSTASVVPPLSTGSSSSGSGSSGSSSPGPYGPPAKSNVTYTPPSTPSGTSGSGSGSSGTGSAPASSTTASTGGATTLGSSVLLALGAIAAFAYIN